MTTTTTIAEAQPEREAVRAQLQTTGLSPEQIEKALVGMFGRPTARTVSVAVAAALPRLERDNPGTHATYAPYLHLLADGLPEVCACTCAACSGAPCPCTDTANAHSDNCQPANGANHVDCANRFEGLGAKAVTDVKKTDIDDAGWWCQRRGLKRTIARNTIREAAGRVPLPHDGRGSRETLINACRWLFEQLIDDAQETGLTNVAKRVKMPTRQETVARSLDPEEFVDVYRIAVSTGRDPVLDGLLLRHLIVQAVRRGGAVDATAGGIDVSANALRYWDQKREQWRERPTTKTHLQDLIAHAITRGPRIPAPADAPADVRRTGIPAIGNNDPLFYRQPVDEYDDHGNFVSRTVQPVTAKHFESLFTRIRRHCQWADNIGLRPHDIRHTSGRLIYKAADQQLARLHLAHDSATTTDHYLSAHMDELAKLKAWLFES